MKTLSNISLTMILFLFVGGIYAQSPKKYLKTGEEFEEAKNYADARDQYTKALELDAQYVDAYVARARVQEQMFQVNEAIEDYTRAVTFDPDEEEYYYELARLYLKLDQPRKALEQTNKALEKNSRYLEALMLKTEAFMDLKQYNNAQEVADQALDLKKTSETYVLHGVVSIKLKDWGKAEFDFEKAINADKENIDGYIYLSQVQVELGKKDEALETCEKAMKMDDKNVKVFVARANVYKAKVDYPSAINDLSQALMIANPKQKNEIYTLRGQYYHEFGQYQGAINDYTKVLTSDADNVDALYKRGMSFEAIIQYDKAMNDYEALLKLSPNDDHTKEMLEAASVRLYELNKESDVPQLVFIDPADERVDKNLVPVPKNLLEAIIHMRVEDASLIEMVQVDGVDVTFDRDNLNPDFKFRVRPKEKDHFEVVVRDVYKNKAVIDYKVRPTEIDTPMIRIVAPYASDDGEIYLDNDNPILYIEGRIEDESLIKSVYIEGTTASFATDELTPLFSATLDISNKKDITMTAEDIYGNKTTQKFRFNREGAQIAANNPMGKTWVVFIENANYVNFASLEGPTKDVRTMKSAFANYEIHNIIVKKDMSKRDFEKFFAIELRDLVRSNHVNSLLVWYAGHGKFLNETGYWIPIDAKRDDEFTYFNINSLKAAMQSYSKYITHTLVITDACESGPSFYQAMRSTSKERLCTDWEASRFKSSQVFSSAGYELASDNSQFTKTFANTLLNNPDACVPIETVVSKVSEAVSKGGAQKPKFGKIAGLEDENGTFFFMKR